jgi:hypothetical protein
MNWNELIWTQYEFSMDYISSGIILALEIHFLNPFSYFFSQHWTTRTITRELGVKSINSRAKL